jgi:hypothetical protein
LIVTPDFSSGEADWEGLSRRWGRSEPLVQQVSRGRKTARQYEGKETGIRGTLMFLFLREHSESFNLSRELLEGH